MRILETDEFIEKIATLYQATIDSVLLRELEADKVEYSKVLSEAISKKCIKSFHDFYLEQMCKYNRFN